MFAVTTVHGQKLHIASPKRQEDRNGHHSCPHLPTPTFLHLMQAVIFRDELDRRIWRLAYITVNNFIRDFWLLQMGSILLAFSE